MAVKESNHKTNLPRLGPQERPKAFDLAHPGLLAHMRSDLGCVLERDPAARNRFEVLLFYPGVHALWGYRIAHWFWTHGLKLLGRGLSQLLRFTTGIEIHPGAQIGPLLFIDHGMGVVIGETAEVGANVTLYHGVTLGGTSLEKGKRHPTLKDNVVVGAGAKVLGAITIGENSRIGANAVVVKDVPANSVVVGVPGQVVMRSHPRRRQTPDLEHGLLPDTIGDTVVALLERVEQLEQEHLQTSEVLRQYSGATSEVSEAHKPAHVIHHPDGGVWHGEDFSI